jgi:tetratricopeptide (TPR) repeat protein
MRRSAFARWLVFVAGILLVILGFGASVIIVAMYGLLPGWLNEPMGHFIAWSIRVYGEHDELIRAAAAVLGVGFAAMTSAYGLLLTWHYAEMNLPGRLHSLERWFRKEFRDRRQALIEQVETFAADDTFIKSRPRISALARFLRFIRSDKIRSEAQWLVASIGELTSQTRNLTLAASNAQYQLATAHLVCGHYHRARAEEAEARSAFERAIAANPTDIDALSAAAASARRNHDEAAELNWLSQLHDCAQRDGNSLMMAKALRRQAEVHLKRGSVSELLDARDKLTKAIQHIGNPAPDTTETYLESGRQMTLFCEVQAQREKTGRLAQRPERASQVLGDKTDQAGPGEQGGEKYGKERVNRLLERLGATEESEADDDPE